MKTPKLDKGEKALLASYDRGEWLSIVDEAVTPEEHKRILIERLSSYKSGKSKPISHEELMRRFRST